MCQALWFVNIHYNISPTYLLTQVEDISFHRENWVTNTGFEAVSLMTKPALGKDILTLFRPSLKSGTCLMPTSIWPIPWLEDRHKARASVEQLKFPIFRVPLFIFLSPAHLIPSSSLYLSLALFSNSVRINNHYHDGKEPSVGNSEPFRFGTNRRK